jgi:hypothetical protein
VLRNADFPFDDVLYLNSESRFVKLVPTKLSGSVTLSEFRVADADGKGLGEGFEPEDIPDAIREVSTSDARLVDYFTIAGERISTPHKGLYLMRIYTSDGKVQSRKVIF